MALFAGRGASAVIGIDVLRNAKLYRLCPSNMDLHPRCGPELMSSKRFSSATLSYWWQKTNQDGSIREGTVPETGLFN